MLQNLKHKIRKFFQKEEMELRLPKEEVQRFVLSYKKLDIGVLTCEDGEWTFKYTEDFKQEKDAFNPIIGFPDLDKIYKSESLWPFFLVRIPGLGQPKVQEAIEEAEIDPSNEAQLLKLFGKKTIANPFILSVG